MTIRVVRFDSSHEFLDRAEPFLLEDEVVNSLILGVATAAARQNRSQRRHRPFYALIEEQGEPVMTVAWTLPHKLLLSAHTPVSAQVLDQLAGYLTLLPSLPSTVFGPAGVAGPLAGRLAEITNQRVRTGMAQRLYVLREILWPNELPTGSLHPASPWNRELLAHWVLAFQAEAVPDDITDMETALYMVDQLLLDDRLFIWLDAPHGAEMQPVAMAARARPTQSGIAVNLVYTPPAWRRQGFATATVAHLSQRLLNDGWQFCTLYTDLANPTSNHIYETIGYVPVLDFTEYLLISGS